VLAPLVAYQGETCQRSLIDLICRIAALADAVPEIAAVRLNPVMVSATGAAITDARIALAPVVRDPRPPVRRL
jgi:hypothetical protein